MIDTLLYIALGVMAASLAGCLYRLLRGPTVPDRVAALDAMGACMLAMTAIFCMAMRTEAYVDIILVIGILTFIGTVSLARYIERGVVLEGDRDGNDH